MVRWAVRLMLLALVVSSVALPAGGPPPSRPGDAPPPPAHIGAGEGLLRDWGHGPQPDISPRDGPYPVGGLGYDLSFPDCRYSQPSDLGFSVIGLNGGLAFTSNPCFSTQWRAASGLRAVYLNSGYDPANGRRTTGACAGASRSRPGADEQREAWAIGCSEIDYSLTHLRGEVGQVLVPAFWLDVETSNSWSETDLTLNQSELSGMIDRLGELGRPIGVYSSVRWWDEITGGLSESAVQADWVAGEDIAAGCGGTGFSGAPVWMVQTPDPIPVPGFALDSDYAC